MLILQRITYTHPNREPLFADINFTVNRYDKIALVGNNGAGKSTLLKIMAGSLLPSGGVIKANAQPYYVPQLFDEFNDFSIAQALGIDGKSGALRDILNGNMTDANLALLDDDWAIEERCKEAFGHWEIEGLDLTQKICTLSGGQKTKVFLAGIAIHNTGMVLLDEPSNHLDAPARQKLYNYIKQTTDTVVVVSHDRALLNLLNTVYELDKRGLTAYGGNYDFYAAQKMVERDALKEDLKNKEKAHRKAKETEREAIERKQKLDAKGKKKQEKAGMPTILMNTLRNNAEKSAARMKGVHAEKVNTMAKELGALRKELPGAEEMKMNFDDSALHTGKLLVMGKDVNFGYGDRLLWNEPLNFEIRSGDRVAVKGGNGSGKTTLIKIILGELQPVAGTVERVNVRAIYIDQDYLMVNNALSVYEQAQRFNTDALQEHEIKIRLTRFLFTMPYWDKQCKVLSGGEKMRLILCCLMISNKAPDMIVLDEPTNNLDIQNIEILTSAINEYRGTLIVISHDGYFLQQIHADRVIAPTFSLSKEHSF